MNLKYERFERLVLIQQLFESYHDTDDRIRLVEYIYYKEREVLNCQK